MKLLIHLTYRLLLIFLLFLGFSAFHAYGQEIELSFSRSVYLNEASIRPLDNPKVDFPNMNNLQLYKNKKLKKRISKYESKRVKDYHILDSLYLYYVTRFGPKNFMQNQDLDMVWRLGQIKEILNDTSMALYFYGMALKNQSKYYKEVKLNYDALKAPTFNDMVDLEYYYKIVQARLKVDSLTPPRGVQLAMSKTINTKYPEYGPYMHPTSLVLLFTSRRPPKAQYQVAGLNYKQNEDLYLTVRDDDEMVWNEPVKLPHPINSELNEGSACLSADAKKIYFVSCNDREGFGGCDIYEYDIDIDPLTGDVKVDKNIMPRNLGPKVNSGSWDSHPCISHDGKTLFFSSNRSGGFGRTDLYVSKIQPDGTWGKAENLGPVINTQDDELSPFLSSVNNILYFSSKGQIMNFGGFDIYKSTWFDGWSEPQNLGPLINTPKDEYYFTLNAKGDTLFYATDSAGNPENFDLYSYGMPMGGRPDAIITMNGYLIDSVSHKPLTGIVVALDLDRNIEIEPIYINKYGYFEFHLVNNGHYQLYVLGEDAIRVNTAEFNTPDSIFSNFDFSMEKGKPIIIDALEFTNDQSDISEEMEDELEYISDYLTAVKGRKLIIRGHTDADGDPNYNLRLSQERANNIKKYLIEKTGMDDSMFVAIGSGSSKPIFPNDSPENKARNRRVEFEFIQSVEDQKRIKDKRINEAIDKQDDSDDFLPEPTNENDPLGIPGLEEDDQDPALDETDSPQENSKEDPKEEENKNSDDKKPAKGDDSDE